MAPMLPWLPVLFILNFPGSSFSLNQFSSELWLPWPILAHFGYPGILVSSWLLKKPPTVTEIVGFSFRIPEETNMYKEEPAGGGRGGAKVK